MTVSPSRWQRLAAATIARVSPPLLVAFVSALIAVGLLQWRHVNARERLRLVTATNERMQQARLGVSRAYVIAQQVRAGDATFDASDASAQLDLARQAIDGWLSEPVLRPLLGSAQRDPRLRRLVRDYSSSIAAFRTQLLSPDASAVDRRTAFAALEREADAVAYRIGARRAEIARREERDHALTVFLLTFFILLTGITLHELNRRRQEARGALVETDARLRLLMNQVPVGSWVTDTDLRVRSAFGALLSGNHGMRGDIVGRPVEEILPADRARVAQAHRGALEGRHAAYDVAIGDRHLALAIEPMRDHAGRIAGAVGAMLDITERHRLEAELRQAQKMDAIGRLAAGVAHDFNNLLAVIRSYAQLLADSLDASDPRREDAAAIDAAGERGARLVRQLLAVGRQQPQRRQDLDLVRLVDGMLPMLRQLCGERVAVHLATEADSAWVAADLSQLEQVVLNLVTNARDAMHDSGRISLRIARATPGQVAAHPTVEPGEYVMLSVADTGHGMDEATRARIFDPFYTTKREGHGLGLATVYGILQQSGGSIHVESAPGVGSTFSVLLRAAAGKG